MNKTLILLTTVAAFTFSVPAFATDESAEATTKVTKDSDGNYKANSKTENTDAAGTTNKDNKKVKVDVDSKGSTTKTVTDKSSVDPKGLMNKETAKTKDVTKTNADGTVTENSHKKVVNGKTVEDTSDTTK